MAQWLIVAQVRTHGAGCRHHANGTADGWHGSRQVPSFVLDGSIQGIMSPEHAQQIAAEVINPAGFIEPADLIISASLIPGKVNHARLR